MNEPSQSDDGESGDVVVRQQLLTQDERSGLMQSLAAIARATGEHVQAMAGDRISDTVEVDRHQFSTVDGEASSKLRSLVDRELRTKIGTFLEESDVSRTRLGDEAIKYPLLVADAVEGSTNAKRGLAGYFRQIRPILAGTSLIVLEREDLGSIAASAFYDFASQSVFSSVRTEPGSFLSFRDDQLIPRDRVLETQGDTQVFAFVPGYSHRNVAQRAEVQQVLVDIDVQVRGGTRSSAQDLLEILCNGADAYVDLRALFSGSTASRDEVLHAWDIGAMLPVMDGLGFVVVDAQGRGWQQLTFRDRLALVVARPLISQRILKALQSLSFVGALAEGDVRTLRLPPREIDR